MDGTVGVVVLILLHGPQGADILINPAAITSLRAGVPGKPSEYVTENARCIVSLSDGKFVSVLETCEEVRWRIKRLGE
jgi:hypothetical protein